MIMIVIDVVHAVAAVGEVAVRVGEVAVVDGAAGAVVEAGAAVDAAVVEVAVDGNNLDWLPWYLVYLHHCESDKFVKNF